MWEIEPGKQDSLAWAGRGWEVGGKVAPACLFLGSSREKFDYGEVGGWRGRKEQRVNNKIYSKNMAQSSLSSPGCFQLCIVVTAVFPEWGRRLVSGVRAAGFTFHRCKSLLWRMKIPARSFSQPPGSCCVRGQHERKRAQNGKDVAVCVCPLTERGWEGCQGKIVVNGKLKSVWFHREQRGIPQETGPAVEKGAENNGFVILHMKLFSSCMKSVSAAVNK